jgi:hypothetical protein
MTAVPCRKRHGCTRAISCLAAPANGLRADRERLRQRDRQVSLRDEVELLEPAFARAGEPFALVAHSSGAAEYFIDFWMGRGAWARTPESRKRTDRGVHRQR